MTFFFVEKYFSFYHSLTKKKPHIIIYKVSSALHILLNFKDHFDFGEISQVFFLYEPSDVEVLSNF